MKVLIVASFNKNKLAPFVMEQARALVDQGCIIEYFGITGKGILGYIKTFPSLRKKIEEYQPDIIHAHYGLSGLLANLQRKVPVVTTYHGSDINNRRIRPLSRASVALSKHNIFVSRASMVLINPSHKYSLLPCGVDLSEIQETSKSEARRLMNLAQDKKYVLFSSSYDNVVKNYPLAKEAMSLIPDAELLELKGFSREEVSLMMCAVDCLLMTSISEGSPQVVKEAMACECPIVSVDVGDVKELFEGVDGCIICDRSASDISNCLTTILSRPKRTDGRKRLMELKLDNSHIAQRLLTIYEGLLTA